MPCSESSPRCLREVQSSVERDKDPSTGALRETHTTLEKESQKGPGSVSQVLSSLFPPGEANITPPRREPLSAEESPGPNRTLQAPSELPREERAMDREKVSLTPGSIINVPLGATLEMQLKLPTDTVVPEGQASTIKKTTESRMESQQTKRVAQCGDHSIAESSHAVQKLMSDSRSMVSQSSFESNEAQRITKTTAQQSLTETTKVSSSLPSGGSMYSLTVTNRSTTTTTDPKKVAPPTAPKPKLWLNTDIKSDVQRFGFPPERPASSASDASLPGQGVPQQGSPLLSPTGLPLLPKFYEPPGDNNSAMDFDAFKHHKKKTFSSSSFYEEPNCIYPTVEEQVELARKIADSLSADTNRTSRGANMFFKRVKRSHKWIHEAPDYSDSEATLSGTETSREDDRTPDPLNVPYKVSKGPPRLKLILDPRHLQDANTLRQSGISIVEHSAISPEVCLDLVKDLNSPCGKGAAMFAKRKKKSEEWVVDVDRIKAQLGDRWPEPHQPVAPIRTPIKTPVDRFKESLVNPRLRIVKSPWEAALESPIGSCEKAFAVVRPHEVVESVIRAAEAKGPLEAYQNGYGTYDSAVSPVPPPVTTVTYNPTDPCLARARRGWRGPTSQPTYEPSHSGGGGSSTGSSPWPPQPAAEIAAPTTSLYPPMPKTSALSPAPAFGSAPTHPHISLSQFQNFNSLPRSWSPRAERAESFRPVRPPAAFAH
ncbi:hypothetical protein IscW_ISCW020576 [Ixodes scapularis]|uniref:Uncharacterized protein n=1 Tax=Ixodes scapularis TaxID=6945 RepID=B7Q121_IXOSC|nr:hypothetical protein IscW_ISCW020576 [Ixodes scapularis]|eukprot:XP_002408828.1 hypothetical protein IscW_ISCW020576 [Ixodes scapularis]